MGFITLTGDSDGDLHTAALHNNKFGAIASVLNGNVDRDNLAAPQSLLHWSCRTGFGTTISGDEISDTNVLLLESETGGGLAVTGWGKMDATNAYYLLLDSMKRAPVAMRLVSVDAIIYQQDGAIQDNYILKLQKSPAGAPMGTYSNMASGTFVPNYGVAVPANKIRPAPISMSVSDGVLDASQYFRVVFYKPTNGGTYGPDLPQIHVNCTWKAYHVA